MTDLAGWTPRPRPERKVHEGRYLRLEPLDARHRDDLFEAGSGEGAEALWRYLPNDLIDRAAFNAWLDAEVSPEELEKLTTKMSRLSEEQARQVLEQAKAQS